MKSRRFTQNGSVLIVVLWASLGLVSISLLFGHSMLMNYRGTDNDVAGRQADQAIEGAVRYIQSLYADTETPGEFPDPTTYEAEAMTVGEATFWMLGRPADADNGTTREYGLVDEASKININTASLEMLEKLDVKGMTPDLAEAIVEWRDSAKASGSSSGTKVKGKPFESLDELAAVVGAAPEILYGEDTNRNGVLDTNEDDGERSLPADNADGKLDTGIAEYLTVFTREPKMQHDGSTPRLDITKFAPPAPLDPLIDMLVKAYPEHEAELRQNVRGGAYTSVMDFFVRSGIQSALTDEEFDKIASDFAIPDPANPTTPLVSGLINVNTATETVLACVPGLQDRAADLVTERIGRGSTTTGIAWAARLLTAQEIAQAGPFLTGESYQVSADVAAVGRHGRGYRRALFVLDHNPETDPNFAAGSTTTTPGTRVVYRRNLAPFGWALGRDVREQLALKKEVR